MKIFRQIYEAIQFLHPVKFFRLYVIVRTSLTTKYKSYDKNNIYNKNFGKGKNFLKILHCATHCKPQGDKNKRQMKPNP